MPKINPAREMEKSLKELGDFLEDELKGIYSYLPIRGMEFQGKKNTVCDKLRQIYVITDDPKIKELVVEATVMAKKMTKKLLAYRKEKEGKKLNII